MFEDLQLGALWQPHASDLLVEVFKPIESADEDSLEELVEGVNLIPATGDAIYATGNVVSSDEGGNTRTENRHLTSKVSDLVYSMQSLNRQLSNNSGVNLVISQFGTDLRLGHCEIEPRIDVDDNKDLSPTPWAVSGLERGDATEVSSVDGNPAFGSTPADFSVVSAIQQIADNNGHRVFFYPFMLMDIPDGNSLPSTDGVSTGQEVYPWRGRITTNAPSDDKTAAAQTQVDAFFGSAAASDFTRSGETITYTGSASDKGYRRFILHYAHLCAAAALSLDTPANFAGFYIGTEMRGLTQVRSSAASAATGSTVYPGVNALVELLEDVRALFDSYGLTSVKLSYAADWSEYHSHRPSDGSNDVYFNMDALWGHADCDYVAIDNYLPISDWRRKTTTQEDFGTGTIDAYNVSGTFASSGFPQGTSLYDPDYLEGQIEGGEGYHYFYASDADRSAQTRTKIEDGSVAAEHWIFRQKDIRNWWTQTHHSRPGGTRDGSVAALSDGSGGSVDTWGGSDKEIYFSEFGCPAVDFGTNQPNVFYDPKSSESFFPYFSKGTRDDVIQRLYYEAVITYWRDNAPTVSSVKMLDPTNMFAWTWDARPYPAFPFRQDIWSDGPNYELGHWLNGRVGILTLAQLVREICNLAGLSNSQIDVTGLLNANAIVRGFSVDDLSSPRDMLNSLMLAYFFDGFESEGKIKFVLRNNTTFTAVSEDELVVSNDNPGGFALTRAQQTDLPATASVSFIDEANEYQPGAASGLRLSSGANLKVSEARLPIVLDDGYAQSVANVLIEEAWAARDRGQFALPPSKLAFEPGDGLSITLSGREYEQRVNRIERTTSLAIDTESHDPGAYETVAFEGRTPSIQGPTVHGNTLLRVMDLPLLDGDEAYPWAPKVAAYQSPFPPSALLYETTSPGNYTLKNTITNAAIMGFTTAELPASEPFKFDNENVLSVQLFDKSASLLDATLLELLDGANVFAIKTPSGAWEVLQFQIKELTGTSASGQPQYDLTRLLRGQLGTETEIADPLPVNSEIVLLTPNTVYELNLANGKKFDAIDYRYGPSTDDVETSGFYQDLTHTGQATGLLPYAPVHLHKALTATDEVTFSWVRRTRIGGDDFEAVEVPLSETTEQYDLEILDPAGPTSLRLVSGLTSPTYTYTAAAQSSDGGHLDSYLIRVWQVSAEVGQGRKAEATL